MHKEIQKLSKGNGVAIIWQRFLMQKAKLMPSGISWLLVKYVCVCVCGGGGGRGRGIVISFSYA